MTFPTNLRFNFKKLLFILVGIGKKYTKHTKKAPKGLQSFFEPIILFVKDESFDYAEKIENLIKQTNKQGM